MSKPCAACGVEKNMSEYYDNYQHYSRRCKECISIANRRVKKPTGFAALEPSVQNSIKQSLQDRRQKLKDIADEHGINYATFGYWVRKNKIV